LSLSATAADAPYVGARYLRRFGGTALRWRLIVAAVLARQAEVGTGVGTFEAHALGLPGFGPVLRAENAQGVSRLPIDT
jgi:hypothetical protein